MNLPTERLINELQTFGVRLADPKAGVESRRGGAGPSDHKALTIDGVTCDGAGPHRARFRQPLCDRRARRERTQSDLSRWAAARGGHLSGAPPLLRSHDRGRRALFEDRRAAWPRRARHDRAADLHSLSEPHENLPVLRHRAVLGGRTHDRAQDARAACGGGAGRRHARRREAHGDDDRERRVAGIAAPPSCAKAPPR